MTPLVIEATDFTPYVSLDPINHIFEFNGISRPEDVIDFYNQVLNWLLQYDQEVLSHGNSKYNVNEIRMIIKLSYFNSASSKSLLQILEILQRIHNKGFNVNIDFFYDEGDDQMREDGEDLAEAMELKFNFLPIHH